MFTKNTQRPAPREIVAAWQELYPDTFNLRFRKPLKIGIREDMLAAGHGLTEVTLGLKYYVGGSGYLRGCQKAGAVRIDLAGQPRGIVTEADATYAFKLLAGQAARSHQEVPIEPPKPPKLRDSLAALRAAAKARREQVEHTTS
ncbi:ProQ/FinO family protein [Mesorhizobium sp. M0317]|uniref:ProQ/FINO family protein n=1 Tax=Mesorhizobium sp. M0317 TaxID=2956935 RepID=UPI0033351690